MYIVLWNWNLTAKYNSSSRWFVGREQSFYGHAVPTQAAPSYGVKWEWSEWLNLISFHLITRCSNKSLESRPTTEHIVSSYMHICVLNLYTHFRCPWLYALVFSEYLDFSSTSSPLSALYLSLYLLLALHLSLNRSRTLSASHFTLAQLHPLKRLSSIFGLTSSQLTSIPA